MKIKYTIVCISAMLIATLMTSCLGDQPEPTYSANASITEFSIEDIETQYKTQIAGVDTTLTRTLKGTDYPFAIDQVTRLIHNVDSLPVGTNVSRVVAKITADTEVLFIEREKGDTIWTKADSLDFRNPVKIKVLAANGEFGRPYTIKINVHQVEPDTMIWRNLKTDFAGTSFTRQKAICFNKQIMVFAERDEQVELTTTSINDGAVWTKPTFLDIPEKADYSSVILWGEKLYIIANGHLYCSTDAIQWTKVETAPELKQLVACVYAPTIGELNKIMCITADDTFVESQDGQLWELKGAVPESFPKEGYSFASYPLITNSSIYRTVLIGNKGLESDTATIAWSNITTEDQWNEMKLSYAEEKFLPKMENVSMIRYNNELYAFGGIGTKSGRKLVPFGEIYQSTNNGVNWYPFRKKVVFPKEFVELYNASNGYYSTVVDENHNWWIMWGVTGEVWRGRINKLSFNK